MSCDVMVVLYVYLKDYDFYDCVYVFMYFFLIYLSFIYLKLFVFDIKYMNLYV